jgi:hypothetical protein
LANLPVPVTEPVAEHEAPETLAGNANRSKGRFVQSESTGLWPYFIEHVCWSAILAAPNERWAIDRSVRHCCLVGVRYRRESSNHDHVAFRAGDAPTLSEGQRE